MKKLEQIYEGKAKKVFRTDDPELYIVDYKDDATALDGLKKGTIAGKGVINNQMTNRLMAKMEKAGIPTHFVQELSERDWNTLFDYISGQYSDGWGEGFEQRDIPVADGVLNVHFWQPDQHCPIVLDALPGQEPAVPRQAHKPKMKLIGQDGNIFSILGRASRLLRQNGQNKQAEEMFRRVQDSGDYYKALNIISEYVQTELSASEKGDTAPRPKRDQQER